MPGINIFSTGYAEMIQGDQAVDLKKEEEEGLGMNYEKTIACEMFCRIRKAFSPSNKASLLKNATSASFCLLGLKLILDPEYQK